MRNRGTRALLSLAVVVFVCTAGAGLRAAEADVCGEYELLWESDGRKAEADVYVWLKLQSGRAKLRTAKPGERSQADGTYQVSRGRISIHLAQAGIDVTEGAYELTGNLLTLPFRVLGDPGTGTSEWKRIATCVDGGSNSGSGTEVVVVTPDDALKPTTGDLDDLVGNWTGSGAGEEVRYRHRHGLLTLIVRHNTEFFFHVDTNGAIEGEGTIEYDMVQDTEGLDSLVAYVHGMLDMMPLPKMPGGSPAGDVADSVVGRGMDKPGVTRTQYKAPHLKYGKEIRGFKFRGEVIRTGLGGVTGIELQQVGDFTVPDGSVDNELVTAWEVNNEKEESTFPCWSPFLAPKGHLRSGPGGIWIVDFQEKGEHRNQVKVWEEYGYVWTAKRISPTTE